jgi:hypothetical protein
MCRLVPSVARRHSTLYGDDSTNWYELSLAAQGFLDLKKPTAVPLLFFGELAEFPTMGMAERLVGMKSGLAFGMKIWNQRRKPNVC